MIMDAVAEIDVPDLPRDPSELGRRKLRLPAKCVSVSRSKPRPSQYVTIESSYSQFSCQVSGMNESAVLILENTYKCLNM